MWFIAPSGQSIHCESDMVHIGLDVLRRLGRSEDEILPLLENEAANDLEEALKQNIWLVIDALGYAAEAEDRLNDLDKRMATELRRLKTLVSSLTIQNQ